jgi:small multidrug resistance pump
MTAMDMPEWGGAAANWVWAWLIGALVCSAAGNVLSKYAHHHAGYAKVLTMLAAIGSFGMGLILYTLALTDLPLGVAYPVLVGGSMALVAVVAALWFGERMTARHVLGMAMILAGLFCLDLGLDATLAASSGGLAFPGPTPVATETPLEAPSEVRQ